ncbi:sensor histidine kinase [Rhodococcus erythropolis]|uniref:sensor histidine kinase n=1 Tax=Rhodococcus erythropolis TaxID=1833 RepID=UPI0040422278
MTSTSTWGRWCAEHPRTIDLALTILVLLATWTAHRIALDGNDTREVTVVGVLVTAIAAATIVFRRRYPFSALAVAVLLGVLMIALSAPPNAGTGSAAMVCLYYVASTSDRRRTFFAAVSTVSSLMLVTIFLGVGNNLLQEALGLLAWLLMASFAGAEVRSRRAYLESVEARAVQAERMREDEARHRVVEERMRIARDLHDVVAHHIALVNLQVGVASHLIGKDPEKATTALRGVEETSKAALDEIRATVGVLRDPQDGDRSMKPAPGLSDLPALVDQFVSAGMEIEVRAVGSLRPLGPAVDLTAYRIIQEALVNASKHALPGAVSVSLSYEAEVLVLSVENSGTAVPSTSPPGYGLLGMKERAQAMGGEVSAGFRADGGFRVDAQLPLVSVSSGSEREES